MRIIFTRAEHFARRVELAVHFNTNRWGHNRPNTNLHVAVRQAHHVGF